ncbi:conserved hypothetical protein [Perkinsus marinus ATCC 50983]|uniref:Saccharopine dehydrogenase NADP binding domain-containing protein n=1 Tax=Perkinsus marinus (strain ATCC 50983 / TXsc) TaxID=423536 RepID=C5L3G8_PERM5|nr:conserved hypothetical protein [Perkinsus marinus ATCC 50983]EER08547.1 conserved hypothetical protein [Perkinsus marinus ATCC 50983]|eukprot:XP_002776731.1 conserved hypothetical protein [Perkinsus marinus ATCC 50983]
MTAPSSSPERTNSVQSGTARGRRGQRKCQRDFDVVVFGCTGFVGKLVLEKMHRYGKAAGLRVAAAGRDEDKVKQVLQLLNLEGKVGYMIAGVYDLDSITAMVKNTRLVLNCVGPYALFGEPVVAACAEEGTDYMDLSGEVQFIEKMQLKYTEKAKESGAVIMSACAWDSVPEDLGFQLVREKMVKEGVIPYSVEGFVDVIPGPHGYRANFGTYESAVLAMSSMTLMVKIRKALRSQGMGPKLYKRGPSPILPWKYLPVLFDRRVPGVYIPFLGTDPHVIKRTQQMLTLSDPQYVGVRSACYFKLPNGILPKLGYLFYGILVFLFSLFEIGRKLLLNFPEAFTHGMFSRRGPTVDQMETTNYKIDLFGRGYSSEKALEGHPNKPDVEIRASVTGPDPGYNATSGIFTTLAMVLLTEKDTLATKEGGVYTPAVVFRGSTAARRLTEEGYAAFSANLIQ